MTTVSENSLEKDPLFGLMVSSSVQGCVDSGAWTEHQGGRSGDQEVLIENTRRG